MWIGRCSHSPVYGHLGVRGPKNAPVEGEHELFGFLTTEPNTIVAPVHPKAIPVIPRTLIAGRTKSALAAAKARGIKLGNPNIRAAQSAAVAAVKAEANRLAGNLLPIIAEIRSSGATTLRAIAGALNARGNPYRARGTRACDWPEQRAGADLNVNVS